MEEGIEEEDIEKINKTGSKTEERGKGRGRRGRGGRRESVGEEGGKRGTDNKTEVDSRGNKSNIHSPIFFTYLNTNTNTNTNTNQL